VDRLGEVFDAFGAAAAVAVDGKTAEAIICAGNGRE